MNINQNITLHKIGTFPLEEYISTVSGVKMSIVVERIAERASFYMWGLDDVPNCP